MKRMNLLVLVGALLMMQSSVNASEVEYSGVVELSAGTIVGSDSSFSVDVSNPSSTDGMYDGSSALVGLGLGLDATNNEFKFQIIGSIGKLTNGQLSSNTMKFDVAAYYMGSNVSKLGVGLHVSTLSLLSPTWNGDAQLKLGDSSAIIPGVAVIFGDQFFVKVSVDYVYGSKINVASINVNTVVNSNSITVDGPMVQVAFLYKF